MKRAPSDGGVDLPESAFEVCVIKTTGDDPAH
jgi:hypothetical protein